MGGSHIEILDGQFGARSVYDLFDYSESWALPADADRREIERIMVELGNGVARASLAPVSS